jgi:hypothetical protein
VNRDDVARGRSKVLTEAARVAGSNGRRTNPPSDSSGRLGTPRLYTLRELVEQPELVAPPKSLINLLAYPGRMTLLSAREKIGKSTLLGQALATLSSGGIWLGDQLEPAKVLWYAIDEPLGDTVRRFREAGANCDNVFVADERPMVKYLPQQIRECGAQVVVVDSLTEWWSGDVESERDAQEVARFLSPVRQAVRQSGVSLVLVHHSSKNGRDYRGSSHIGAVVDVIAMLRSAASLAGDDGGDFSMLQDDGRRVLTARGRGVHGMIHLGFDGEHYTLGEETLSLDARILRALTDGPMSGNGLVKKVKAQRQRVLERLPRLLSSGQVSLFHRKYSLGSA